MCPQCDVHKEVTTVGIDIDQRVGNRMKMICYSCHRRWFARDRYLFWPVSIQWRRQRASTSSQFWRSWRVQTVQRGYYDIECRLFAFFLLLGPLQIILGR